VAMKVIKHAAQVILASYRGSTDQQSYLNNVSNPSPLPGNAGADGPLAPRGSISPDCVRLDRSRLLEIPRDPFERWH
jgi:hypothetical protein